MTERRIQTYECRLRKSRVLRFSDVGDVDVVHSADELARAARAAMRNLPHEQVWLFTLSGKNDLSGAIRLGEGGLHACALTPVDVLRPVLIAGASAFALAHNHPSGDPTPSVGDWELTIRLHEVAERLGCILLDHVIVTNQHHRWVSMREQERWPS